MKTPTPIEPLEARIAPAVIPMVVLTFTDGTDNDTVKLLSDKPITATVSFAANGSPSEITIVGAGLDGASLTTVVTKSANGDGFVNIGRIVANNLDLGAVTVKGDLGKIVCGNTGNALPALKSLKVRSMGLYGTSTQTGGDLVSTISGDLGSLTIAGDAIGVRLSVGGSIGTAKIGGDLRGTANTFSGRINAVNITSLSIGGALAAGAGDESGKLILTGNLGKLSIGGAVIGALDMTNDPAAGQIFVNGNAGPISIRGDVIGAVSQQLAIDVNGNAGPISIRGSLIGGAGISSGGIDVVGNVGAITVGGSVIGGGGVNSARIEIGGNAGTVTIRGSVQGSGGEESARIEVNGNIGPLKIGGSVVGSTGYRSGSINIGGSGAGLAIGGDVRGGTGGNNVISDGQVLYFGDCNGTVKIGGSIIGGPAAASGDVKVGNTASLFIGGSILGDGIFVTGQFVAFPSGNLSFGNVPSVTITGDVMGSPFGGGLLIGGNAAKFTIGGSIIGPDTLDPMVGTSNQVRVGSLGVAKIGGSIIGANDPTTFPNLGSSFAVNGNVGSLTVTGSLLGGNQIRCGSINIAGNATAVKIAGSLMGGTGGSTGALRVGGALGALTIGGSVISVSGDYSALGGHIFAASIGSLKIGGDAITAGSTAIITSPGAIGPVTLGGDMASAITGATIGAVKIGGDLRAPGGTAVGGLQANRIASIFVAGDVRPANAANAIAVTSAESCGPIVIGGDLRGNDATPVRLHFTKLASLTVKGSVSNAEILGGYSNTLVPVNEDATIGPVTVGRDWVASSLIVGAKAGADMKFGTGDDAAIGTTTPALSRIASITIKGQVAGSATAGDHFGLVAQSIGPMSVGGGAYTPGSAPIEFSAIFDDVTVRVV